MFVSGRGCASRGSREQLSHENVGAALVRPFTLLSSYADEYAAYACQNDRSSFDAYVLAECYRLSQLTNRRPAMCKGAIRAHCSRLALAGMTRAP